ncbi:MAG: response regulator transcription factor [Chitinophagaceae bacterium]
MIAPALPALQRADINNSISLLVVDDHLLMLTVLKELLSRDNRFNVVGTCMSGQEAENLYEELLPDVTIMDVYMKPMSGIEATRNILRRHPEAKILGLSNFYTKKDAEELCQLGAKGYTIKIASPGTIAECVKKVHAGELCFDESPDL